MSPRGLRALGLGARGPRRFLRSKCWARGSTGAPQMRSRLSCRKLGAATGKGVETWDFGTSRTSWRSQSCMFVGLLNCCASPRRPRWRDFGRRHLPISAQSAVLPAGHHLHPRVTGPANASQMSPAGSRVSRRIDSRLLDEAVDAYVDWREECAGVWSAYRRWLRATVVDASLAFSAYRAAVDREECAAHVYGALMTRIVVALNRDPETPACPTGNSA